MALTSIVNIVQNLARESLGQGTDSQQGAQAAVSSNNSGLTTLIQDIFTPSNPQNSSLGAAQEAGLFQVSQLALVAAATGTLALQSTPPQTDVNPAPAPVAASNVNVILPVSTANSNGLASAVAPAQTAPPAGTQGQILAFNQALTALGLNSNDIEKLDQIATLVNLFSPTAFNDLIRQFQALAQQAAQLSAVNAPASSTAKSSAYQVQELNIQFNGSQPSSNAAGLQGATNGLLLGGVQFTLANGSGQIANVQSPQKPAGAAAV